jgi:hypothetical protein
MAKKFFKNFKNEHILGIVALLVLLFGLHRYSQNKTMFRAGMSSLNDRNLTKPSVEPSTPVNIVGASNANTYSPYNGNAASNPSNSATSSQEMNKPIANPSDLLPTNSNSSWEGLNPVNDLKSMNLLNPTQLVGINTQGASLRNANLQIRSEPSNPRTNTNCPWNISTIEEDKFRRPLEIGSGV